MSLNQFGPIPTEDGRIRWNLWAPRARSVHLHLAKDPSSQPESLAMIRAENGFWERVTETCPIGTRYGYRLDDGPVRPDPASRWQPEGVHALSAYWASDQFRWFDTRWSGLRASELVIYELHLGAFTPEGTLAAALDHLDELKEIGINTIELMPVAQFPGNHGWGYDGAYWYSVQNSYGGPTMLQEFVDVCHGRDMAVVLDVVYNHFGPEGNYFGEFGPIESATHTTPWGRAINFDGPDSQAIRDFVIENALYWVREFHIDGLRLDAVHAIVDDSQNHILSDIQRAVSAEAERSQRHIHVIAESNLNNVRVLLPPERGGYGIDMQWNDDFHHCVHTLLTGERNGYYVDFDSPEEQLEKCLNKIFVYDGIESRFLERVHGAHAEDLPHGRFIVSVQTHDQVGNRAIGDRFGTLLTWSQQRLAAGLLLLTPFTPMLFMGEEYGERNPFPFFCDYGDPGLRRAVHEGRLQEFASFGWEGTLPDALDAKTFASAQLSRAWHTDPAAAGLRYLYQELIAFRKRWKHRTTRDDFHAEHVTGTDGTVLVYRGRFKDDVAETPWHALFNCSGEVRDLSVGPLAIDSPRQCVSLRSDEPRFLGKTENPAQTIPTQLAPYSFLLIEPARDHSHRDTSISMELAQ